MLKSNTSLFWAYSPYSVGNDNRQTKEKACGKGEFTASSASRVRRSDYIQIFALKRFFDTKKAVRYFELSGARFISPKKAGKRPCKGQSRIASALMRYQSGNERMDHVTHQYCLEIVTKEMQC